jgi:uncharacterized protein (TIGR02145 family)
MLKLCPLLILAASLLLGCIAINLLDDEDTVYVCGGIEYNPQYQICENGVLRAPCGNKYYNPVKQFCSEQDNEIYDKCGVKNYNTENQECYNATIYDKCGTSRMNSAIEGCCNNAIFTLATQFCFYIDDNIYDKCGGVEYNLLEQICDNDIAFTKCEDKWYDPSLEYCDSDIVKAKETFIDARDGNVYKYVIIGDQTWLAENLRYETSNTKCYGNNPDNCKIYGILYDWNAAKTACPLGWHLPSDAEWYALFASVNHYNVAEKLKANSTLWLYHRGTDDFGFTALPGGYYRYGGSSFMHIGEVAGFWSATAGYMNGSAHFHYLYEFRTGLDGFYVNDSWVNVRCIKDQL